jgi:outer membrane protein OmpA-like peptidoglycan-associated protein
LLLGVIARKRRRAWLLAAFVATGAAANEPSTICQPDDKLDITNNGCWYAGAGLGQSKLKPDDGNSGWKIDDDTDMAWQITIGYHLYPHWFMEARWADLGEVTLKNRNPLITDSVSVDYSAPSLWGGYLLRKPDARWNVFAKVGYAKLETDGNGVDVDHMEGAQLSFGIGAQWRLDEHWFSQIEYVGYDKDAHYAGISLNRYFGHAKRVPEPASAITTVEPVPAPQPVPEPVKPTPSKALCKLLDGKPADINFETASATLTAHAQDVLRSSARLLQEHEQFGVEIHAHTDNQGSAAFNQALSQKRADAVRIFLVSAGISASRLNAFGHGEDQPIADNQMVAGRAQNRRVELKPVGDAGCN